MISDRQLTCLRRFGNLNRLTKSCPRSSYFVQKQDAFGGPFRSIETSLLMTNRATAIALFSPQVALQQIRELPRISNCSRRRRRLYQRRMVATNRSPSSSSNFSPSGMPTVDLRSDTLTSPTEAMLRCVFNAPTGDDVMGEDPTVLELERYAADLFEKDDGLFLPTGTMANLAAVLSHCHGRASEMICGSKSHICLYEGGNAAGLGGVHTRQIPEEAATGRMSLDAIRDVFRTDDDDHYPRTTLICLENTHNNMGGVALPMEYIDEVGRLARDELKHHDISSADRVKVHVDGARIMNASVCREIPVAKLCRGADSVSLCLSKGLGAPLGSLLVGESEFIRLAKRARKQCGGGMRQVGVVASMGMYALQHNVSRLGEDHRRAQNLASRLHAHGFQILGPGGGEGKVDTNIVYFALPPEIGRKGTHGMVAEEDICSRLNVEYGVKIFGGFGKGGRMFRAVTYMGIDDKDIDRAVNALVTVCFGRCTVG